MIWLELRKDPIQHNPGWNFLESVWAPVLKKDGSNWPFWNLIGQVSKGDLIFHLSNIKEVKRFIGYSSAATDGYVTTATPSLVPHEWDYTQTYYKVDLENFKELDPKIELSDFFQDNNQYLREFFKSNGIGESVKKRLFYVIQSNRLQCLNGAYFSEFDGEFTKLLVENYGTQRNEKEIAKVVSTGVTYKEIAQRIGHQEFSDAVKKNYGHKCCFPGCNVEGTGFLISGHIARWADNELLRGEIANGLCLCLMHDKAFEKGMFTIDENFNVIILSTEIEKKKWLSDILYCGTNVQIKPRKINPSIEAIKAHWKRIGYK